MMEWFKRHLNWTWVIFYLLTLVIACLVVLCIDSLPPPMKLQYTTENITVYEYTTIKGGGILRADGTFGDMVLPIKKEHSIQHVERVIDEDAIKTHRLWGFPVYFLGVFLVSRWVLKQKGRSLYWIWLTFIFPITPLILDNKEV